MGWAWKGVRKSKKTMRNSDRRGRLESNKPEPKTPPINKTTQITPKPFPIIQKPSETSVSGNSAASTYWKQSFWVKRESPQKKLETSVTGNSAAST